MLENLLYGSADPASVGSVLEASGLMPVLAKLPDGLATPLGESGTLISAGEGQRVRLARAMMRHDARLVLLDEPFVGLERERRRALLAQARQRWSGRTLLYVTHDVSETRAFDRVIVLERGRLLTLTIVLFGIDAANGPILSTILWLLVSATNRKGDFSPAR